MARKKKHEEHVNHERWLVSYADFITLLFAFFVVMYAISAVNQGKYRVLSDSLVAAFRSAPKTMEPIQVGEPAKSPAKPSPNVRDRPDAIQTPRPPLPRPLSPFPPDTPKANKPLPESHGKEAAPQAQVPLSTPTHDGETAGPMQEIAAQIKEALGQLADSKLIEVRSERQRVEIELKASILFISGSARVQPEAVVVLERIAGILKPYPNAVEVSGYTDDDPIRSLIFPSNWELSAARAASVVHLFADTGVSPGRMAAIGYGEYQPIAGNDTPEGRAKNRRVILAILAEPGQSPDLQEFKPEPKPVQVANKPEQTSTPVNPSASVTQATASTNVTTSLLLTSKAMQVPAAPAAELPAWLKLTEHAGAAAPAMELLKPATSYSATPIQASPAPAIKLRLPERNRPRPLTPLSPIAPMIPIGPSLAPINPVPSAHPATPVSAISLPARSSPPQVLPVPPAAPRAEVNPAPASAAPAVAPVNSAPLAPPATPSPPAAQTAPVVPPPAQVNLAPAPITSPVTPASPLLPAPHAPVNFSRPPATTRPALIAPPIQLPFSGGLARPPIYIGVSKPATPPQGAGK
ncbi:MAG: flagellar motor protein MotD [Gammaproteobacteria bacterium]